MSKLTVGSLFSGIGGLDYGLEQTNGFTVKWQVEIDEYCQKVLAKHWPNVARYGDIRTVGRHNLAPVDLLAGGFPCQPHSLAGKRQASGDERDLWGEFYRVICELKPRWVLAENVPGLLSSENGRFLGRILRDLAAGGYDVEWQVLSASAFGAPHIRERVFIVADSAQFGCDARRAELQRFQWSVQPDGSGASRDMAVAKHGGCAGRQSPQGWSNTTLPSSSTRTRSTSQSRICRSPDGLSEGMDEHNQWPARPGCEQYDWEAPRVVTERVPERVARLKALGNAVVPQIATYIGNCILASIAAMESEIA